MATKKKAAKKAKAKYKSAVTGKFVKPEAAKANPRETYKVGKKKK